ncbi:MAG: hypothetical protein EGR20_13430 [Alistipes onderdonkii]|nr:hypothetical protein [Alistipes onderdonkii]
MAEEKDTIGRDEPLNEEAPTPQTAGDAADATVEKVMLDPIWHFCPTEFNEDTARQLLGEVYDQKLY